MAALARHTVLKAPDKADFRALAAAAAADLVAQLPTAHQHMFVGFIARLARTPKVRIHSNVSSLQLLSGTVHTMLQCLLVTAQLALPARTSLMTTSAVDQVAQRLMAVEVAHLLLSLLPDPYSPSSAIATGDTPGTPGQLQV